MTQSYNDDIEQLRARWDYLYRQHLPSLAKARDPVQKKWPVYLDHCFARIVLDNAVGKHIPWTHMVKAPAVKHADSQQLQDAITLAESIANGSADLVELNDRSLQLRKRTSKRSASTTDSDRVAKSQRKTGPNIDSFFPQISSESTLSLKSDVNEKEDMDAQLNRISSADLTAFRKLALSLLCQIPRGRYSTYQALSDHISKSSHKTCARAVGNAMRTNPFAPGVPCHRVLASDGTLGGFKGAWGEQGSYATEKHKLLREEGVKFDSAGKVKGSPFRDFR